MRIIIGGSWREKGRKVICTVPSKEQNMRFLVDRADLGAV